MTQPNILLIVCDQLTPLALPFHGHPIVQTPHLSKLAAEGVIFDNAYCNSPLCGPSRAALMTGQLPSRTGVYDNAAELPAEVPTFAHYLRALGYQTSLCGKMHFVGPDQLHGFEERLTTDIYPADFGWVPDWENFDERPTWYHNMLSVVQAGTCITSNQLDYDETVAFRSERKLYELARNYALAEDGDERPFLLTVSFTHPHDPFAITPDYWDRYDHDSIDLPTVPPLPVDQLDAHSRRLHHVCGLGEYAQTAERIRNALHAYYAMISYIDELVGRLLRALEAIGQRENTIVMLTSDHGEMLGERGLWYKMSFFEHSARVPLLIHAPERFAPRRVTQPVSIVDLLPTLVDLAAPAYPFTPAAPLDGSSLLPLLTGENSGEERMVAGEILFEGAISPCVMLRRGAYKYIYSEPDPEQLYNVEEDPHERTNLVEDSEHAALLQEFRQEVSQRWDLAQLHQDVIASQRRRRLVHSAMGQGARTSWDFQPFQDAGEQYMRSHMDLNVLERTARYPTPGTPALDGK